MISIIFQNKKIFVLLTLLLQLFNCTAPATSTKETVLESKAAILQEKIPISPGAHQIAEYLPILQQKNVGLVVNQTSTVGQIHLVDTLRALGIQIQKVFSPEHGFRGTADAGEKLTDSVDPQTGIPLISLYGKKRKPSVDDLADLDLVIFDIQDVGARFYTYISTMHYVMEACADYEVPLLILDRPNPNGHYVDGPVREATFESFIGMHPVPVVHGMTIGEYAQMINGEGWLANGASCSLQVIDCKGYNHKRFYQLPVKPSPNLPDMKAIYCYPFTCFFEGTEFSEGRGTKKPFQLIGHPDYPDQEVSFTPTAMAGAQYPKHQDVTCYGIDLSVISLSELQAFGALQLNYLITCYQKFPDKSAFFKKNGFFNKLAGNATLRAAIENGHDLDRIRQSWQPELNQFKAIRKKYLRYEDFED